MGVGVVLGEVLTREDMGISIVMQATRIPLSPEATPGGSWCRAPSMSRLLHRLES